jgi:Fe2+ or Zn2+ uptake regulation protein
MSDKIGYVKETDRQVRRTPTIYKWASKCSSSEILKGIKTETSISTLKRTLQTLVSEGLINSIGDFKSRKYEISIAYDTIRPIDVEQ